MRSSHSADTINENHRRGARQIYKLIRNDKEISNWAFEILKWTCTCCLEDEHNLKRDYIETWNPILNATY